MGALDLGAIASEAGGPRPRPRPPSARARRDSLTIKDWEYVKRTFYWIAHPLQLAANPTADGAGILPIVRINLYLDDKDPRNDIGSGARLGFALREPRFGHQSRTAVGVVRGSFSQLTENVDYRFDLKTGVLTMEHPVERDHVLGVIYLRDDGHFIGSDAEPGHAQDAASGASRARALQTTRRFHAAAGPGTEERLFDRRAQHQSRQLPDGGPAQSARPPASATRNSIGRCGSVESLNT